MISRCKASYANRTSRVVRFKQTGSKLHINKNTPLLRSNKKQKAKNSKGRRKSLDKMTQRSERKVEKTFEPLTKFSLIQTNEKKTTNCLQIVKDKLQSKDKCQKIQTKEDESLENKVLKANRKKY
jgi:hypothetical protein